MSEPNIVITRNEFIKILSHYNCKTSDAKDWCVYLCRVDEDEELGKKSCVRAFVRKEPYTTTNYETIIFSGLTQREAFLIFHVFWLADRL